MVNELRKPLGEAALAAAWAEGQALSPDAAIEAALALSAAPATETTAARGAAPHGLSERELEVLRLLAAGRSNRETGDALFISPATAARHVANICAKLDVASRAEATALALQQGIV